MHRDYSAAEAGEMMSRGRREIKTSHAVEIKNILATLPRAGEKAKHDTETCKAGNHTFAFGLNACQLVYKGKMGLFYWFCFFFFIDTFK